ncbi:MAG: hypothetical protein AABX72_05145 [Nanoarchaeota archaeon]
MVFNESLKNKNESEEQEKKIKQKVLKNEGYKIQREKVIAPF